MQIQANHLQFEVQSQGEGSGIPVVMIMGLGGQLTFWPQALVDALSQDGRRVITFDNRDIGLSSHLTSLGTPNMLWTMLKSKLRLKVKSPYSLQDMAQDTLALMDALGLAHAHIVGISMGGMIAQRVAATAPDRVASLTSIMSSSGAPGLPGPRSDVRRALLTPPASTGEDDLVAHAVRFFQKIGSPGFNQDWDAFADLARLNVRRDPDGRGTLRQLVAILADQDRHLELAKIRCPTQVIHGEADPLVPITCGRDTANRIAGAAFQSIPGMGHDLPQGVLPMLATSLQALWQRAEQPQKNPVT